SFKVGAGPGILKNLLMVGSGDYQVYALDAQSGNGDTPSGQVYTPLPWYLMA
ncbi:unnamed protein product, partial [marine sediment metagenome]